MVPSIRTSSVDSTHPGTAAALAYINKNTNLDSCGQQSKAYMDSIKAGNSRAVAAQVASVVYQQNYAAGVSLSPACLAAEVAWKKAVAKGQDPVLPAALAYMEASPSDSPCYVSGKEYIQVEIVQGRQLQHHHDDNDDDVDNDDKDDDDDDGNDNDHDDDED